MRKGTWTSGLLLMAASTAPLTLKAEPERNVLFITVDDFRPELPAYGRDHVHAPHMTRLTDEGLTFNHAYVQQAVCQPARANVLTGARPDTTRIYNVFEGGWPTFRTTLGNDLDTLPSLFKDNGYWTAGYGKNFHHVDNPSWTVHETFYQTIDLYQLDENRAVAGDVNQRPPWEYFPDNLETNTMDAKVAAATVEAIQARAVDGQPFFIAAGFWKPHLPFSAPQQYWDLYDRETLPIATGLDALPVQGAIPTAFYDPFSGELTTYRGGRPPFVGQTPETQAALANGTFTNNQQTGDDWGIITVNGTHIYPEDYARALTHGYYACTSFIDAQIGKILDALEDPLGDGSVNFLTNTVIVLWGDHGMHVGQHGSWPKHTNMDIATRIPFIIWDPDLPTGTRGVMTDALMESVDIMPTVLEMVGIPKPSPHPFEGVSLVPLLDDPHQAWKTAAFSQYPKEVPMNSGIWYMGYAMRTPYHTYMQWREMDATDSNPISLAQRNFTISSRIAYEELYDMVNDPTQRVNLSGDPPYRPLLDALGAKVDTALITNYANTQNVGATDPVAPVAHAVAFFGGTDVGDTLTAHYIYSDANGDLESGTTLEWVRADDFNGPYETVVGTGDTYTLQEGDAGAFVKLRVTPQTDVAPTTGEPVLSATAVVAGVGFNDGVGLPAPESSVYEGFDYDAGGINASNAGGIGWDGGWYGNVDLDWGGNSGAAAGDKSWSLPTGYHYTPEGRSGMNHTHANTPFRGLASGSQIDLTSDTVYFSFLFSHDSSSMFEYRFYAGTTEITKLQVDDNGQLRLVGAAFHPTGFHLTSEADYLITGKLVGNAVGNDTLYVSVYDSSATVPEAEPTFSHSANFESSATIDRIMLGIAGNAASVATYWDELRMGPTWGSVIGVGGEEPDPDPDPPEAVLLLHLTFDEGDLTDSSPDNRAVTGTAGFASEDGRHYATLNGVDQAITAPIIGSFPNGLSIAFWTLAQDGENGMPKNTALGWARQGGTTGDIGDGLVLGFGWNNSGNALVRVGREHNSNDDISIPALENWLNTWVHWTVVKNLVEGTIQVYRDGDLYSSVGNRTIIPAFEEQGWATGSGFRIGRYFDTYYKGYLDDYRLYHGVLTPQQVQAIYQTGAATEPTAFNVSISGTPEVGQTLTGSYDFIYPGGAEGDSRYQWYAADTPQALRQSIEGADGLTYQVTEAEDGRYVIFGVTPVGDDDTEGDEAFSDPFLIGAFMDRSLENTVYRLTEDDNLTVAFFGGSITDGAGQNNGLPWRTRTENWLTSTYPEVSFTFLNAAISGTSSEFGVFRTDRHVLAHDPDLVFVEFAVNDKEQVSDARTRATMEGIVRKIRAAQPTADMVFVYTTVRADAINYYENDQLPPRTLIHQQIAEHYGIPVIDVAAALVAHKQMTGYPYRIEHGEPGAWDPAANHYLPDHVHPSNLGHEVYGGEVQAVLTALLDITPPAAPVPHHDPGLLSGHDMVSARILDHTHPDVSYGAGWEVQTLGIGGGGRTDDFLVTEIASTASDIEVAFSGTELGVYYRRMTNGAEIVWNVDAGAAGDTFVFWHETLGSFTSQAMLTTELGGGNHTAVITPQPHNGHEKLAIADWLVLGEHAVLYQDWADEVFAGLDGGSAHPDAAPTADLDGNGWANLAEYAMGTNPLDENDVPWWANERDEQEGDVLILYRRRSPPAPDVHITVEGRMHLTEGDWLSGPTFSEIVDIQPEGDTEVVTERIIAPGIEEAMQYYFRLLFNTDI